MLDEIVQTRSYIKAAKCLLTRFLNKQPTPPKRVITDKLRSNTGRLNASSCRTWNTARISTPTGDEIILRARKAEGAVAGSSGGLFSNR
ncbi:hypothetical protein GCM10007919_69280 [Rhizobium indigoferae]|nr:hypothetical protein GCM10007919_69280 [Rhizobium indigoferae]